MARMKSEWKKINAQASSNAISSSGSKNTMNSIPASCMVIDLTEDFEEEDDDDEEEEEDFPLVPLRIETESPYMKPSPPKEIQPTNSLLSDTEPSYPAIMEIVESDVDEAWPSNNLHRPSQKEQLESIQQDQEEEMEEESEVDEELPIAPEDSVNTADEETQSMQIEQEFRPVEKHKREEEEEEEAKKEVALPVKRLPMEEEEEEGEEPVGAEPEQIQENQQQEQRKVECSIEKENDSLEDGEIFEEGAVIKSLSEVKEAIQAAKKKNKKRGKKKNKRKRQQQEVLLQNGIVEEGPPMMPLHGTPPIHMSHLLGSQPGPGHMHLLPTPGTDGRYLMGGPPMQMMARRGPPIYGYPGEYDKDHQILRVNRNGNMAMLGNKTQDVEMVYQEAEKSLEERRGRKRYQPSKQNQVVEKNEMDVDVDVDVDVDLDLDSLRAAALRSKVIVSMSKIEEKKMDLNEKNQINKEEKENQEKDTSIDLLRLEILKSMHQKNETVMKISSHKEEQKNEEEQKTMSVACSTASITSASSISNGVPTNTAAEVNQSTNGGIHTTNNNNTQKKPMATALFSSSSPASSLRPLTVFSQSIIIHLSPEDLSSPSSSSSLSSSSSAATATAATAATAAVAFTNNTTNSLGNVHSFSSDSNSSSHSNKYISEQKNSLQAAIEEMKRKIKEKEAKIKKNPIEKPCFTTATTTTISAATTSTNNTDSSSANTITFGQVVEKKKESSCSFVMPTPTPTPTPTSPICKAFVAKELIEVKKKYLSALQDFETTQNELQNLDQAIAQVKQAIQFKSSLALNVSSSTTMAATIKATIKATEGK